jgi:hypothetical protein
VGRSNGGTRGSEERMEGTVEYSCQIGGHKGRYIVYSEDSNNDSNLLSKSVGCCTSSDIEIVTLLDVVCHCLYPNNWQEGTSLCFFRFNSEA